MKNTFSHYFARFFIFANIGLALGFYFILGSGFTSEPKSGAPLAERQFIAGSADGQVAYVTAKALEDIQFGHIKFDSHLSSRFFDKYFEYWDPQHRFFTQSDIDEFSHYRELLDDLTLNPENPNLKVAHDIFNRFLERLKQHADYAAKTLKAEEFSFEHNDYVDINREKSPYPKDLTEAHVLWKSRLKAEFLEEKLERLKKGKEKLQSGKEQSIAEKLIKRHQRNYNEFSKFTDDQIIGGYLSVLARLYDPHSDFYTASELESFEIAATLALVGVGLELRVVDGVPTISKVLPGGPASKTNLKKGDQIIAVQKPDGSKVDLLEMRIDQVVSHIRGKKGSSVVLTIDPKDPRTDDHYDLAIVRDEVKLEEQEAKAQVVDFVSGESKTRIGIIELPSFYSSDLSSTKATTPKNSTTDVAQLLQKFNAVKVDGVILDLRKNGGGSLQEAINLTGLFIPEGPVVQIKDAFGRITVEKDRDPSQQYQGPLVVLTSKRSASAAEILAGALKDYDRAIIVGDSSTFGKGTVQALLPLRSLYRKISSGKDANIGGALKLTTSKFYRPSGGSTQTRGVVPDIVLPSVIAASSKFGESTLNESLPWDTIESDKFETLGMRTPYVPELARLSSERIANDPEFGYVKQDIELLKRRESENKLSLNKRKRIQLQKDEEARKVQRDLERSQREKPTMTVYDITVAQARLPGLPAPTPIAQANQKATAADAEEFEDEEELNQAEFEAGLNETKRVMVDYLGMLKEETKGISKISRKQ